MKEFFWQPGLGIDAAALARLKRHFPRPAKPMGEAWFMGDERQMYPELAGDLSSLTARNLQRPLSEITGGLSNFGAYPEWCSWYHFLLGQLVERSHEEHVSSLLESLVSGFMAMYPGSAADQPYAGFFDDALLTLGRCLMAPACWTGQEIVVGSFLHRSNDNPAGVWRWWDASGDFSASMFFCLKYLPPSCIDGWLRSALAISSPHWRAQMLVWLVGAHDAMQGHIASPSALSFDARPKVVWEDCWCLIPVGTGAQPGREAAPGFLPQQNCHLALQVIGDWFNDDVFLDWLASIGSVDYLATELADIPSRFEHLYLASPG
jgi:hypothetical protein